MSQTAINHKQDDRIEFVKDKAQEYLMHAAKSQGTNEIVLTVLRDWLQSNSKEEFLLLYPEGHPHQAIAMATALVGG